MEKLIVSWDVDECFIAGPSFCNFYEFDESTNSFVLVTEEDTVENEDDSIIITMVNKFIQKYKHLHNEIHKIFSVNSDACLLIE